MFSDTDSENSSNGNISFLPLNSSIVENTSKRQWVKRVLDDHRDTAIYAQETVQKVKKSRVRMERSLDQVRTVLNQWTDYNSRLLKATCELGEKIEKDYAYQQAWKIIKEKKQAKIDKICRPTKLMQLRKVIKFVPTIANKDFSTLSK